MPCKALVLNARSNAAITCGRRTIGSGRTQALLSNERHMAKTATASVRRAREERRVSGASVHTSTQMNTKTVEERSKSADLWTSRQREHKVRKEPRLRLNTCAHSDGDAYGA